MFPSFDSKEFFHQFLYDKKNPLLFNNGFFVYLFFFFMILYFIFRNRLTIRTYLFCAASLYFFYKASGFFVVLVVISAIVDFFISNAIYKEQQQHKRKLLLALSVVLNLGLLFYFKYTDFFLKIINNNFLTHINLLNTILPVGISFYTFENISYTIDVYKGEFVPVKKFSEYLLFLSFFPKLVMGPIVRAKDFIPQITKPYSISKEDFTEGFFLIISGLFKKLIISDYIAINFVNYIFDSPEKYTGWECLFAVYGYAIVIYCDFSGYSSIAIGIARWLGFKIPPNFNMPYQSKDIKEFWKRWHISLSSWLQDYLYIFTLGGNRKGKVRTYINLFITMLLGGFWHGASFNFIVWGGFHGLALCINKFWSECDAFKGLKQRFTDSAFFNFISVLLTFHFVCFCWIFFKAKDFAVAGSIIYKIQHDLAFDIWGRFWGNYHQVLIMIFLGMVLHFIPQKYSSIISSKLTKVGWVGFATIFILFVFVYGFFKSSEPIMPIYLKF